jgi:hypothetical protein
MAKAKKQTSKARTGGAKPGAKTAKSKGKDTVRPAKPNVKAWATAGQFTRNALRTMTKDSLLVLCKELRLDVAGMTKSAIVEIVLREQAKGKSDDDGARAKAGGKPTTAPEKSKGATARPSRSGKVEASQKPTAKRTSIREAVWALFDQHQTTDPKIVTLVMATEAAKSVKPDTAFSASHRAFYARKWREARKGQSE